MAGMPHLGKYHLNVYICETMIKSWVRPIFTFIMWNSKNFILNKQKLRNGSEANGPLIKGLLQEKYTVEKLLGDNELHVVIKIVIPNICLYSLGLKSLTSTVKVLMCSKWPKLGALSGWPFRTLCADPQVGPTP